MRGAAGGSRPRVRADPRGASTLLRELHRQRNYRPIADTIHELLEATRAHAGFAFRKGGERVLANVYRLTDLARSFEVGGRARPRSAPSSNTWRASTRASDTSEAPVLEQEGGGVQLMTVHKAKGLEFPVVILADLTAKLTGPQGGDRYMRSGPAAVRAAPAVVRAVGIAGRGGGRGEGGRGRGAARGVRGGDAGARSAGGGGGRRGGARRAAG